jgi:UDP-sugar transporter A1/2/3
MLRRRLGLIQWFALLILFLGISIVEIARQTSKSAKENVNEVNGLLLVIGACEYRSVCICIDLIFLVRFLSGICSGLAGVYFEKVLKGSDVSLWIRELQLAGISMLFSPIAVYILDREKVKTRGILAGYTSLVWISTIVRSIGGLLVALVIKYADNILKGFASSSAIVLACIISVIFLHFQITLLFALGSLFVICSIFLYSKPDLVLHVPIINSLIKNKPIFFEDKK